MRIGIFTDTYTPDINGVVSSEITLKKALERLGHTVFVVTNHSGSKIILEDNVLKLPGIVIKQLYGYKLSSPVNFSAAQYVEKMNLDVIHIQTEFGVGMFARQMAKQYNIPVVYTYHTMYEDYTHYFNPLDLPPVEKAGRGVIRQISKVVANSPQAVIAPSLKTKEALQDYGVKAPIYVIPTGLNLTSFEQAGNDEEKSRQVRALCPAPKDSHIVVFIGRVSEEKSLQMLIEAIHVSKDEKLHLAIVGAGPDEGKFETLCAKLHVEDRVHFLGKVTPDQVPDYYAAFDVFASASLSETQGMTYLEALATGKMICGRRDEVLDGLLDEGKTGYYFDDANELAQKLEQFFALSDEQKQENKLLCRQKVQPFTDTVFAQKVLAVYEQARDDYSRTFIVEKVRILEDFVLLSLQRDADKEPIKLFVPMDDFFELKMGVGTKLDAYLVSSYMDEQQYYAAFQKMKVRLAKHDYTSQEVASYARFKLGLDENKAELLVDEFTDRHLINDEKYAKDKADYWHSLGYSKRQIATKLLKAGISTELVEEALSTLKDETELANALNMAKRIKNTLKEQSSKMQKVTLINKLMAKGYSMEIAHQASERLDFQVDDKAALQMTYNKARRLYSSLPEDKQKQKIRQYCARKGFSYSMIDEQMEDDYAD
jgi:1,2-diacylglycerol 3-alpha-glucosyltransferase